MRTATVRELRNEYRSLLDLVKAGEEVAISQRGSIIARLVPEKHKSKRVDWTKSAALTRDKSKMTFLTAEQVKTVLDDSRGPY